VSRGHRSLARAIGLLLLALALQSWSSCRVKSTHEDDDEPQGGGREITVLQPPLIDPWGRPLTAPIPLRVRE
jgi:heme A synthase